MPLRMSTDLPPIAVSIVNYRTADLVIASLPKLLDELEAFKEAKVVIVDNASGDGSADRLSSAIATNEWGDVVTLLVSERNGGFSAGNNLAFRKISGWEHRPFAVLLLNPDAEVRPGAVRSLVHLLQERVTAGVVGACLEDEDGHRMSAAFTFPTAMTEFADALAFGPVSRHFNTLLPPQTKRVRCDWVTGAAMLVRYDALEQVGEMDDGYFLYFEEMDLQHRFAKAGWETWHEPAARVFHVGGAATKMGLWHHRQDRLPGYWYESWLRYFSKTRGRVAARMIAASRLIGTILCFGLHAVRGRHKHMPPKFVSDFSRICLLGWAQSEQRSGQ